MKLDTKFSNRNTTTTRLSGSNLKKEYNSIAFSIYSEEMQSTIKSRITRKTDQSEKKEGGFFEILLKNFGCTRRN